MRQLAAAVLVVAMLGGCSFISVRGPGSRGPSCTSSRVAERATDVVAWMSDRRGLSIVEVTIAKGGTDIAA